MRNSLSSAFAACTLCLFSAGLSRLEGQTLSVLAAHQDDSHVSSTVLMAEGGPPANLSAALPFQDQTTPTPTAVPAKPYIPYGVPDEDIPKDHEGSYYIPLDSWVYPSLERLYGMGYVDTMFLGMRPYTRRSVMHMLKNSEDVILQGRNEQAQDILAKLLRELKEEKPENKTDRGLVYGVQQVYDRGMYISGTSLRDSYHIGQTIVNDYGRPYQPGFNNLLGAAYVAELGRFSFYARGEYQHAPSAPGYTQALADYESGLDQISNTGFNARQSTIPLGPIGAENPFRIVEGSLSFHLGGHEFSGGKTDSWLGPAHGGAMAWSNNAENIYSFRINRVEPLYIPFFSRILGPLRYDFFYGSLKGHTYPNHPYTHSEMFSFRPTPNFEFGFQRTIIFGGAGHSPVTISKFLKSFFETGDTDQAKKFSVNDPGARFSDFNFSYRLPFLRRTATLYLDSIAHDDVTPISAPRRAAYRTGLYLSHLPHFQRLDLRAEAVTTDPGVDRSSMGLFNYFETVQRQGYTNKGFIMGDWIGREAKGGQAWITFHVSPTEWYELEYLNKKNEKDFISQGTTQNSFKFTVVKRFKQDFEVNYWIQYERWKAPVYLAGPRSDATLAFQLSYYPKLHTNQN